MFSQERLSGDRKDERNSVLETPTVTAVPAGATSAAEVYTVS